MKRIIIASLFGSLCLMASAECEMPDTLSGEGEAALLDEVTVKGYHRYVTIDGPVTTVRIQGSAFEHIGPDTFVFLVYDDDFGTIAFLIIL